MSFQLPGASEAQALRRMGEPFICWKVLVFFFVLVGGGNFLFEAVCSTFFTFAKGFEETVFSFFVVSSFAN